MIARKIIFAALLATMPLGLFSMDDPFSESGSDFELGSDSSIENLEKNPNSLMNNTNNPKELFGKNYFYIILTDIERKRLLDLSLENLKGSKKRFPFWSEFAKQECLKFYQNQNYRINSVCNEHKRKLIQEDEDEKPGVYKGIFYTFNNQPGTQAPSEW